MRKHFPIFALFIILLIGGFLRLYRIEDYMTFLGDEGRDALVVKRMIVDGEFTLLGPITSVGLMHLGPIYYYFMAPFLWLSRLNPVGPAIMVALFSLATVILLWLLAKEFLNEKIGLIAGFFYALSPLVIIHSHSSWNPNILPFWALLLIYSLLKVTVSQKYKWLWMSGICIGILLQLHYVALVFIPITFFTLLSIKPKVPTKYILFGIIGAILAYSPYIVFELRHQFINTKTVYQFVTRTGDAKTFGISTFFTKLGDLSVRLFWRVVTVESMLLAKILLLLSAGLIFRKIFKSDETKSKRVFIVFGAWLFIGIILLSFYTGNIYDYYLLFAFPLPFLLTAYIANQMNRFRIGKIMVLIFMFYITRTYMINTPIAKEPNRLAFQAKEIADFILTKTDNQPYNFALIAPGNSDHAYRYFLEIGGQPPVVIQNDVEDPERLSIAGQLFIVCETQECKPLGHSLWEIAGFGRAEITNEWQVGLFRVLRLIHYQEPAMPET